MVSSSSRDPMHLRSLDRTSDRGTTRAAGRCSERSPILISAMRWDQRLSSRSQVHPDVDDVASVTIATGSLRLAMMLGFASSSRSIPSSRQVLRIVSESSTLLRRAAFDQRSECSTGRSVAFRVVHRQLVEVRLTSLAHAIDCVKLSLGCIAIASIPVAIVPVDPVIRTLPPPRAAAPARPRRGGRRRASRAGGWRSPCRRGR